MLTPVRQRVVPVTFVTATNQFSQTQSQAAILQEHVDRGIGQIRDGDYKSAIATFEDPNAAQNAGLTLEANHYRLLVPVAGKEDIIHHLTNAAALSGFDKRTKTIRLTNFNIYDSLLVRDGLEPFIDSETALLFAEEWLHALQEIPGHRPISSHSNQISSYKNGGGKLYPNEIEVADYFLDRGTNWDFLNQTLWMTRYDRGKILSELLGVGNSLHN